LNAPNNAGNNAKEVWFDGRKIPLQREDIWSLINNSLIEKTLVTPLQRQSSRFSSKTIFITEIKANKDLSSVPKGEIVLSEDQELLDSAKKQGYQTCITFKIEGKEALEQSWKDAYKFDYAVVDFDLPTNIPLELVIARLEETDTVLLKHETNYEDLKVAFGVLEKGSDGVLFESTDIEEIVKVSNYLTDYNTLKINLQTLVVTEVKHIGMGARACIDTTGLMTIEEGMIVGSTSHGGIFVCSETHHLPYMNLRPFRVNAGAIHSYVWMPNDTVEYLSDLSAGSKVLCVSTKGQARELAVGRVKIEMRPLLSIKGKVGDIELNVIVQDDWHIRIMAADGQPKNATGILPGCELLAHVCEPGRHVGIKVNETIIEK